MIIIGEGTRGKRQKPKLCNCAMTRRPHRLLIGSFLGPHVQIAAATFAVGVGVRVECHSNACSAWASESGGGHLSHPRAKKEAASIIPAYPLAAG